MGIFGKRTPTPAPTPDPTRYDIKGYAIFDLLSEALAHRGLALRRGTGSLGNDKWGDGEYHFKFNADPIVQEPSGIGMFVDDVPFKKAAWNALTIAERQALCRDHVVSFKLVPGSNEITDVTGGEVHTSEATS